MTFVAGFLAGFFVSVLVGVIAGIQVGNWCWQRHAETGRPIEPLGGKQYMVYEHVEDEL